MDRETEKKFEIMQQRSYKIFKGNEIIQKARFDLNITELKELSYVTSMVKPSDDESTIYRFSIKDFCVVAGLDASNGHVIDQVKTSLKKLRDESFWIINENGMHTLFSFIESPKIDPKTKMVELRLHADYQKYVLGLFDNYTQYELLCVLPMKSTYSIRIYELLKSYVYNHSEVIFELDSLKKQLACENYTNYKDLRVRVLDKATTEINNYTDLEVWYEPWDFAGKKVLSVKFHIRQRDTISFFENTRRGTATLDKAQCDGQMSLFEDNAYDENQLPLYEEGHYNPDAPLNLHSSDE